MKKKILIAPIATIATAGVAIAPIASCSNHNGIKVEQISFKQEYSYIDVGSTRDFNSQVKILPENASDKSVTWSIKDEKSKEVASVDANTGVVTGLKTGYATLTCTSKSDTTKSTTQTIIVGEYVALNDFNISYPKSLVYVGDQFKMNTTFEPYNATTAKYADQGWVEWTSLNPEVATVEGNGNVTAKSKGSATLIATPYDYNPGTKSIEIKVALSKSFTLKVDNTPAESIVVSPSACEIGLNDSIYVTAKVLPQAAIQDAQLKKMSQDDIVDAEWDEEKQAWKITAKKVGVVSLLFNSKSDERITGICTVTVSPKVTPVQSIEFINPTKEIKYGESWTVLTTDITILPAEASLKGYKITSSNPEVAYVDFASNKKLVAKSEGTTEVTLESEDGVHKSTTPCTVTVKGVPVTDVKLNTDKAEVKEGNSIKLTATVYPETATIKDVTWSTSNPQIALVDQNGLVTGVQASVQPVTITATTKDGGKTASCLVSVTKTAVLIENIKVRESMSVKMGQTETIVATVEPNNPSYPYLSWYTSDDSVVSIQGTLTNTAVITPKRAGVVKVYAVAQDGSFVTSNHCVVTTYYDDVEKVVLPETKEMFAGEKAQLESEVVPKTASQDVMWASNNPEIVDVDDEGVLTAHTYGKATITCTSTQDPSKHSDCVVTAIEKVIPVTDIKLNPTEITLTDGESCDLPQYKLSPEDTTEKEVFWKADNENIFIGTNKIYAQNPGTTILTCTAMRGQTATCKITINEAKPTGITAIYPERMDLKKKGKIIPTVWPVKSYHNGVTYYSDRDDIVYVDRSGNLEAKKPGTSTITLTSVDNTDVKLSFDITVNNYTSFIDDSWENVCKYANEGLASLHEHYYLDCEENIPEFRGTLIGYEKTIKLFDKEFKVRVVDESHDDIYDETVKKVVGKAALSFETVGTVGVSQWHKEPRCKDYSTSTLYQYINDYSVKAPSIYNSFKNSNPELFKSVKNIQKDSHFYNDYEDKWQPWWYRCQVFALTYSELNLKINGEAAEGSAYKFYDTMDQALLKNRRTKTDYDGKVVNYWTTSPRTSKKVSEIAWAVNCLKDADYIGTKCTNELGVSFGFCI